jgi:signal transduction histidine kinase
MNTFQMIGYPLLVVFFLEILLGIVLTRHNPRKSPVNRSAAAFSFFAAGWAFFSAISYLRASQGLDFSFSSRLEWIGWLMIPAALQFVFYLKDENSPTARFAGMAFYPFWLIVFLLCLFTDLVEPGDVSLVPFLDRSGPLEKPLRLFGAVLVLWSIVEIYRLRKLSTGIKRTQLNYFLSGTMLFAGGVAIMAGVLPLLRWSGFDPALGAFFGLPWVALTWYAMTRHGLFEIRRVLPRTAPLVLLAGLAISIHIVLFKLFEPALGAIPAILFSLSLLGALFIGIRSNRRMRGWMRSAVVQERHDYQKVLRESIYAIATILDLDELLEFIISRMRNNLDVDSIRLFLRAPDGRYELRQGYDVHERIAQNWSLANDVVHWLQRTGRVVLREELEAASGVGETAFIIRYFKDSDAEAVIPLFAKDQMLGVLTLGAKNSGEPYTPGNIDLLEALAGHVAVAIEHSTLYEKMEEKVRERTRELEEAKGTAVAANAAKSEFLSNISHELRTPLNSIIGFSGVMKDGAAGPLSPEQQAYVKDIWESGKHLLRIINNILDLSKIEAGMMELEFDDFCLKELLEGSLSLFREKAQRHRITLSADVSEDVDMITADKTKIKQVALNLLANAVKFTPDGGSVRITARRVQSTKPALECLDRGFKVQSSESPDHELRTMNTLLSCEALETAGAGSELDGDFIEISVTDTGIGMSSEDCERLFQPFLQLDNTPTRKYEGTGLGLYLCRKIVELHGGRIRAEGEPGKGARFSFTIPQSAGSRRGRD